MGFLCIVGYVPLSGTTNGIVSETFSECLNESLDALQRFFDVAERVGIGNARKALAALAKSCPGNNGKITDPKKQPTRKRAGRTLYSSTGKANAFKVRSTSS